MGRTLEEMNHMALSERRGHRRTSCVCHTDRTCISFSCELLQPGSLNRCNSREFRACWQRGRVVQVEFAWCRRFAPVSRHMHGRPVKLTARAADPGDHCSSQVTCICITRLSTSINGVLYFFEACSIFWQTSAATASSPVHVMNEPPLSGTRATRTVL